MTIRKSKFERDILEEITGKGRIIALREVQYVPLAKEVAQAFESLAEALTKSVRKEFLTLKQSISSIDIEMTGRKLADTMHVIADAYSAAHMIREGEKSANAFRRFDAKRCYIETVHHLVHGSPDKSDRMYGEMEIGFRYSTLKFKSVVPYLPKEAKARAVKAGWTKLLKPANK